MYGRKKEAQKAKPGMHEVQNGQVNGSPRRIQKSKNAIARQELPHLNQVAERPRRGLCGLRQVRFKTGVENLRTQALIQPHTGMHQHPGSQIFGKSHDPEQRQCQQGHRHQRQLALADHDAVVDLQHVERGRQHEQVGQRAQHHHDEELAPEGPQCGCQLTAFKK